MLRAGRASGTGRIRKASRTGAGSVAGGDLLATAIYTSPGGHFPTSSSAGSQQPRNQGNWIARWRSGRDFFSESAAEAMDQLGEWTPKLFYWVVLLLVAWLIIRGALAYRDLLMNLIEGTF